MAAVGPLLRQIVVQKGEFIYLEGDPLDACKILLTFSVFCEERRAGLCQAEQNPS